MNAHIYAPKPERAFRVRDFDCPIPDRQRRKCGSYHLLVECFGYWTIATCCACGGQFSEEGWSRGTRANARRARRQWEQAEETP